MKCHGKRKYPGKKVRTPCNRKATWLIGSARVGYCDECAANYPKAGRHMVERARMSKDTEE